MDAVGLAARTLKAGEAGLMIAGGVESMSRAPFVMGKAESAFSRSADIFDTTIGWRFVNKLMKQQFGVDSMPETAENRITSYNVCYTKLLRAPFSGCPFLMPRRAKNRRSPQKWQ